MRFNGAVSDSRAPAADAAAAPPPRRWRVTAVIALAAIVVAGLYALVVTTYSASLSGIRPDPDAPDGGVAVVFSIEDIDPGEQRVTGTVQIFPSSDLVNPDGTLAESIGILVTPSISRTTIVFTVGEIPAPQEVILPATGTVQEYPLDSYGLGTFITPFIVDSGADPNYLPVEASTYVDLAGWVGVAPPDPMPMVQAGVGDWIGKDVLDTTLQRAPSTMMLSVLLLLLLVSLATVAVLVTLAIARGRLRAEFGPASWLTAMLFAVLPVRGFFPGSPPIGSWMDILIVFWVILLIMVCVASVAAMLLSRAREAAKAAKLAAEKAEDAVG